MMKTIKRGINLGRRHFEDVSIIRDLRFRQYQNQLYKHSKNLPILDTKDIEIVQKLQKDGIAITSLDQLGVTQNSAFFESATKIKSALEKISIPKHTKETFIIAPPSLVAQHASAFLWGLEERFLNIIESYLELPVAYHGMYFHRDLINVRPAKSKLWHQDMEDYRSIKIIIYFNNIYDDTDGPIQYLPKDVGEDVTQELGYKYGYIQDALMNTVVPKTSWKSCLGASGTVILMDTVTLFHRGKVPTKTDRFALFFDYTSRYPRRPYYCKWSLPKAMLNRMAINLSDRQRQCLLWR